MAIVCAVVLDVASADGRAWTRITVAGADTGRVVVRRFSRPLEPTVPAGIRLTATTTGLDEAGGLTHQRLDDAIADLGRTGVGTTVELAEHPGAPDDADRPRSNGTTHGIRSSQH